MEFDIENSKVLLLGRAAGFYAVENTFNYLKSTDKQYVLVGGVDTCKDVMNLGFLANEERINTEAG
jgi:3-oxoacyl-(acyl-carrier-protein) synthase